MTPSYVPFFVKIEGQPHSQHRSPQGVYHVEVLQEESLLHSACAALSVTKDCAPFIQENPDCFKVTVFSADGEEIVIPTLLDTVYDSVACFYGRATDYPAIITVQ